MDIFCTVIDNYGDAGFCLRLARDLVFSGFKINIYCDDISTIQTLLTEDDKNNHNLAIKNWPNLNNSVYQADSVVIELFSCRLDPFIMNKIKEQDSLLIALDYFSCETWTADFHLRPSYSDNKESFFFFPGVSPNSGGIIIENYFRDKILNKKQLANKNKFKISLFSYQNTQLKQFLSYCLNNDFLYEFTVFEGKSLDNLNNILKQNLKSNDIYHKDNLTFKVISMVSQTEYDEILLNSDLNFVRGEDSIVRAMLVGKPFLWQIYPQAEQAHLVKLHSLFDRMLDYLDPVYQSNIEEIRKINLQYVDSESPYLSDSFCFEDFILKQQKTFAAWSAYLLSQPSLTQKLITFIYQHKKSIN